MSTVTNSAELSPTKQLKKDVADSLRGAANKFKDDMSQSLHKQSSYRPSFEGGKADAPDESEACYEDSEDYQVLESGFVVKDLPSSAASDSTIMKTDPKEVAIPKTDVPWNARTSFTADSPYFDAFVSSEMESFNVLADTLNGIATHTRAFVKQGAIMSDVAKRLSLACKLRSPDYSDDESCENDPATNAEEDMIRQRRNAVGEEMAGILELLGEVRISNFVVTRRSFPLLSFLTDYFDVGF
jgi:hypothetical protein